MKFTDHAFFTHDWSDDEEGRPNHDRVREVADVCKKRGLKIWFEEEKPSDRFTDGVDGAAVVVVFITKSYVQKVHAGKSQSNQSRNEFSYSLQNRKPTMMIAVVMEKCMLNSDDWIGPVGMALGNHLFVDMSEGDLPPQSRIGELVDFIKSVIKKNEFGLSLNDLQQEIKKLEALNTAELAVGAEHTIMFGNTKYEGRIISGTIAHGIGEFVRTEGTAKGNKYVGEFSGSIPDGKGKFTFANSGDVYEGEYRNGRKNGQGTYYFKKTGAKYVGIYKDGKKHGYGVYDNGRGDVYEGEYKEGKKHGIGTMRYKDGRIEAGRFADDSYMGLE